VVEFVDAARAVRARFPAARFRLLGPLGVENRSAIEPTVLQGWVSEGIVDYLGAVDDVAPQIAAADCVVLPSYREGTPRTLLEAAAMARPLVATDVPGCRSVVEDGVNGILCRVRDAEDLALAMQWIIEAGPEARRRMGLAGRRRVERQFDEAVVIERYRGELARLQPPGGAPGH
jgi:glycosyltransferase involved in cell wall biosynthesis